MIKEMETFTARLASFDTVLHPEKRRTSSAKPARPIVWPHTRPSPAELAHAGFFYNPYETNPDNTTCFMCHRALDGWEEDDNPITEHLKHAHDCGWAVMMDIQQHSSNPAEIEDPTSDKIVQARQATFGEQWPHDGKRGWVCQSEKMVEGGWYFCPNEESNDLASCAYCKLSLDGWEPKDDPFDEHYRRSSDCSFFVFAQPPGKKSKGSRSKKTRVSKASSRLSTQSTVSEAPTVELDDAMGPSIESQPTTKTKAGKKSSKSKLKSAKSKKDDVVEYDSQMDVDSADYIQPESSKPKRTGRGKKRTSDEMDKDETNIDDDERVEPEPPTKKRATKSRNSASQHESGNQSNPIVHETQEQDESVLHEEEPKKGRGTTKKKTSSKGRKTSEASSTLKTASDPRVPRDSELDTALEAELEADEPMSREGSSEAPQKASLKKSKSKKKTKKPTEETTKASHDIVDHVEEHEPQPKNNIESDPTQPVDPKSSGQKPKSTKATAKRGSSRQSIKDNTQELPETRIPPKGDTEDDGDNPRHHESFVSVEIPEYREQVSDAESSNKGITKKKTKQKSSTEKAKKKLNKIEKMPAEPPQFEDEHPGQKAETGNSLRRQKSLQDDNDIVEQEIQEQPQEQGLDQPPARRRSSKVPPKTAERYSDIPQEKQFAKSLAESRTPDSRKAPDNIDDAVSPLPSISKSTLSSSPQSSDAENHPPSTRPSSSGAHVLSPSKQQTIRVPLAASTPSPSKRNANPGNLKSSHPWTPIDIDEIILSSMSDKENVDFNCTINNVKGDLTSPEKKMTVEEWILWNAKKGEEKLKRECERLVGQFEKEGARAMRTLEGIECID